MTVLIRTSEVPAAQRRHAWLAVLDDTFGPIDVRIGPDILPRGEIRSDVLGRLNVGRIETSTPHSTRRTPRHIRRDSPELYRAVLVTSGSVILAQDDRMSQLGTGNFAIYDYNRPYEVANGASVKLAVFSFPREMLGLPVDSVRHLTALPINAEGAGALAGPLLRRVAADVETYQPSSAARLSEVTMDLISAAVAERADERESISPDAQERALLLGIYTFIDQHLGNTDLSPRSVATAHHVSLRYLHRLFESEESSLAACIRQRRLEKCRKDLADPAFQGVPVSAVAARWGLPDSAHFSRLFRRTYGIPPIDYRRRCANTS